MLATHATPRLSAQLIATSINDLEMCYISESNGFIKIVSHDIKKN